MVDSSFLDWPFFDDGHRDHAQALRAWTAKNISPLGDPGHEQGLVDGHCRRLVAMLGEAGWLKACVPGDYGGAGPLDVRRLCLSREILGYTSGLADFAFAMQGLGSGPISLYGSEELKQRYLPMVANGSTIAAFAISESGAGSDVAAMTTTATKDGSDFVLDGAKTWISNAGLADHYVVFARTGGAPGAKGLSAFVVDAETPGLEVTERIDVIAPHPLGSLGFDGCRVPAANMLGNPGDGFKVAMATLDIFRATVGAAALGFARRALDEAVSRSKAREAFGQPLSGFQL
ncbi:MAG: acyl-CoA dehydrogenase family protein, partial [Rhodospirillales bacterium]|nr:acyl-CoA dehydrogenase family protein [Rhodospirillales bacterium]